MYFLFGQFNDGTGAGPNVEAKGRRPGEQTGTTRPSSAVPLSAQLGKGASGVYATERESLAIKVT
ncbi:hypothetical protein CCP4SC76_7270005 [Gammaproteobacteria bacterium]